MKNNVPYWLSTRTSLDNKWLECKPIFESLPKQKLANVMNVTESLY